MRRRMRGDLLRRFAWPRAAGSGWQSAPRRGLDAPFPAPPYSLCRAPPVDDHADRDCGDAERHQPAGDALEPCDLGRDDDERQHESGAESQQGGLGAAHPLRRELWLLSSPVSMPEIGGRRR